MKSSINNANKPPKFDQWKIMFIDGIKVSIVNIIYLIPVILIAIVFLAINPLNIVPIIKIIEYYPNNVFSMLNDMLWYLKTGFVVLMLLYTYMIIIYPFINIAVAYMAYNDSKLKTAFKFREILHKISTIGWKNFTLWYIVIKILFLTISYAGSFILFYAAVILRNGFGIHITPIMPILTFLIIAPYLSMYFVRSVALFYMSGEKIS
ncbi:MULTISPECIES: DUF4013 domain-containing protein [Methanobacterium]|nr:MULTISPECIES: DUF4013 domain-containing protein [Methanobacterium]KUK74449.1 MAG: hypothetical protein XD90_1196 [Methanobacterium sp. 42_16]